VVPVVAAVDILAWVGLAVAAAVGRWGLLLGVPLWLLLLWVSLLGISLDQVVAVDIPIRTIHTSPILYWPYYFGIIELEKL